MHNTYSLIFVVNIGLLWKGDRKDNIWNSNELIQYFKTRKKKSE